MDRGTPSLAEHFDGWYADMAASPVKDEFAQRHLGLPPHLLSTSLLGWRGISDVTAALRLSPGDTLLDLACGRGGYGRTASTDPSASAVDARSPTRKSAVRPSSRAWAAACCVDAIQFAGSHDDVHREILRVLAPGGRVVLTCWEPVDREDEHVPLRLRTLDLRRGLMAAGFVGVDVRERPDWRAVEREMWQEAAALGPGGDPALRSLRDEALNALERFDSLRRVMATATAPPRL